MKRTETIFVTRELDKIKSVTEELEEKGYVYQYRILTHQVVEANKYVSGMLHIPLASKVFEYCKLRIVEGQPCDIEHEYIPYELVKGIEKADLEDRSLSVFLSDRYGLATEKSEESIMIVRATEEEAGLLDLPANAEVMLISGTCYDSAQTEKPMRIFQITARPSFFRFRTVNRNV